MILFTYGTLKRGYWNNHFLSNSKYLGEGDTSEKYMVYYESYPFAVHSSNVKEGECLPIHGELYEVDNSTLSVLDVLETGYERKTRPIITSDGVINAFVYEWPFATPFGITQTCLPENNKYEWKES